MPADETDTPDPEEMPPSPRHAFGRPGPDHFGPGHHLADEIGRAYGEDARARWLDHFAVNRLLRATGADLELEFELLDLDPTSPGNRQALLDRMARQDERARELSERLAGDPETLGRMIREIGLELESTADPADRDTLERQLAWLARVKQRDDEEADAPQ
jgi:hypothetical protein